MDEDTAPALPQEAPAVPVSELDTMLADTAKNPRDPAFWSRLIELAEESGVDDKVKKAYEELLRQYPNTDSVQIAFVQYFEKRDKRALAQAMFRKFLGAGSPFVDLWKCYLKHVRDNNATPKAVGDAYEFALERIGHDNKSGEIWADYIHAVGSGQATRAPQDKQTTMRDIYRRALVIPLDNIEELRSDFETFEASIDKAQAKKIMTEITPSYVDARTFLRKLHTHLKNLNTTPSGARFDLPRVPTFDSQSERALVSAWKAYLKWEELNPLEIDDPEVLRKRVTAIFRKAVVLMRYYSEIWHTYFVWTQTQPIKKPEEALKPLKDGLEANPASFILNFALAEELEKRVKDGKYQEVHDLYTKWTGLLAEDLNTVRNNPPMPPSSQEDPQAEPPSSYESQQAEVKPPKNPEYIKRKTEYGLVWTQYIRFARRAEGLQSARAVFKRVRVDEHAPWQLFEDEAHMEYHCASTSSQDKLNVPKNISDLALKKFPEEVRVVDGYLAFLISVNDEQNARALFERVINTFTPEEAILLWDRWGRYQYQYGDLETSLTFAKRFSEVYPNYSPLKLLAQRHKLRDIDAIASRDLAWKPNAPGVAVANSQNQSSQSAPAPAPAPSHNKRPASPDYNYRGNDDRNKRARRPSPPGRSDRVDRWSDGRKAPGWERDEKPPPPRDHSRMREREREREDDGRVRIPSDVCNFFTLLPSASVFDGPVFSTNDLMARFSAADVAGGGSRGPPPPPPSHRPSGRPPPDYSPYVAPAREGRGRRY